MTDQAFDPKLTFVRCANWNTHSCPNLKNPKMQHWVLFNERTVKELNEICDNCKEFQKKPMETNP